MGCSSWNSDVQSRLVATNAFAAVDIFPACTSAPTLAQLQAYQAVLAYTDSGFSAGTAVGDVLADYFDWGGRVVVAVFGNASIPITGRWASGNYQLINPAGQNQPTLTLGTILEPASPLMVGVTSLSAQSAYQSTGAPINGGIVVARWSNGNPLIVRGVKNTRNYVTINMYPPSITGRSDFWTGSGAEIMRNALQYK